MANVLVPPQDASRGGVDVDRVTPMSADDTYQVINNGRVVLHLLKAGAGAATGTVPIQRKVDGQDVTDRTFTVPETTGEVVVGPFPPSLYNVPGENYFEVEFNEVTGLSLAAIRI